MKSILFIFIIILLNNTINAQSFIAENKITVKIDGTPGIDCDFSGNRSIQDAIESIKDASSDNRYEIIVYPGIYQATSTKDYNSEGSGEGNYAFIRGKDFVSIKGTNRDSVIITGELPDNLGENFSYGSYQTFFWNANEANIEGVTITAKDIRYPIHIDGSQLGMANAYTKINDTKIIHWGNSNNATNWPAPHPLGLGMSDGQTLVIENSVLQSPTNALAMHTNKDFENKSKLIYKNCEFIALGSGGKLATIESLGSKKPDEILLINCSWHDGYIFIAHDWPYLSTQIENQNYNHCDLNIHGYGNSLFLWKSYFRGYALKILSKSNGGIVRFDANSSAFSSIISNESNIDEIILYNGEVQQYGYSYYDGKGDIKSYAIGHLDVGDEITFNKKFIKSLGKRLGDCSQEPKILAVIIDGKQYEIVFDKDYVGIGLNNSDQPSSFSNTQIINEINNIIGDVAKTTLWAVGNDYYPELSDCLDTVKASEEILNGMVVFKENSGKVRKATEYDKKVYGIALDDIIENSMGRVLIRGYIRTDINKRFKVLTDCNLRIKKGDSLGISTTPGIASKNAIYKLLVAKDDGIITTNEEHDDVIGVNDKKKDVAFNIYPNPVSDFIVINSVEDINSIKIFGITGILYKEIDLISQENKNINISDLANGVYVLKVNFAKGGYYNSKFIKE